MPWSFDDASKREALRHLSPVVESVPGVMDLGAGAGLWKTAAKGLPIDTVPWIAVEAFAPYIGKYKLEQRYRQVWHRDIRHVRYGRHPGWLFIFGDVLEHLDRADALAVFHRAASMGTVAVMMPFLPSKSEHQDASNGNDLERHRYVWRWAEWLRAIRALPHCGRIDVVTAPPGDERNKGCVLSWHRRHV